MKINFYRTDKVAFLLQPLFIMKIIIAPDKFKGSLTSFEVCRAISNGIKKANKEIDVLVFPMADGGDGFAAVMKYYLHTETIGCKTIDALGREINASYEWDDKHNTAIIEMAMASGLALLKKEEQNPMLTSTLGTGILIKNAIEKGATRILLGLGGSATNDAGMGILTALGFQFADEKGNLLAASGKNLCTVKKIIQPGSMPIIQFQIAADVKNVLYGPQGAAYIFSPQKGADETDVKILDDGLRNFSSVVESETGREISTIAGSGAAGGIAAGLMAFFNVEIRSGIELIVNSSCLIAELENVDLVITGEGKIDAQTGEGKVIDYIASLAKEYNIPCKAVCGVLDLDRKELEKLGLLAVLAIRDDLISEEEAIKNAAELLAARIAADNSFLQVTSIK